MGVSGRVTNAQIAAYKGVVEAHARKFAGQRGAEFDDLVQEGLEKVWLLLETVEPVTNMAIMNAQRDWARKCQRLGMRVTERRPAAR